MALTKCKECGNEVSTDAAACPKCGAKPKRRTGCFTWMVATLLVVTFIGMVQSGLNARKREVSRQETIATQEAAARERVTALAALTPEERQAQQLKDEADRKAQARNRRVLLGTAWNYSDREDAMTGKTSHTALVLSTNEIEFDFPYSKPQRARLTLRKHPRYGNDVILAIERGQFNCRSDSCSVRVRFGDGQAQTFSMSEPQDNSSTQLFFDNYKRFVDQLRTVDTLRIEAQFYQEGNRVFEFGVDGLEWK